MELTHGVTDIEYKIIYSSVALKLLKLDELISPMADMFHNSQIATFHHDLKIPENERKEEYDIREVFTTGYFSGRPRSSSSHIEMEWALNLTKLVFQGLKDKYGISYSITPTTQQKLQVSFTIPGARLFEIDRVTDQNYALYNVYNKLVLMTEEERATAFICESDDYLYIDKVIYNAGDMTFTSWFHTSQNPLNSFIRLLSCMFRIEGLRNLLVLHINENGKEDTNGEFAF